MMAFKREKVIKAAEKYVSKGKLEAAIKEYRKVLAQSPDDINTLNRVGDLYARAGKPDEAIKLFAQIAERYTRDGFLVKAIAIYKKAAAIARATTFSIAMAAATEVFLRATAPAT
ncbi:MAG: tetratricopeptide repeat protein, partial [Acidobacteriota bacterium]